ncbi:MAG: hypothetical protein QXS31_05885 [Desulfurococcaceae archaeon]
MLREYEEASLKSTKVREMFEDKLGIDLSKELSILEETLRTLEEEDSSLRRRLEKLSARLVLSEDENGKEEELLKIKKDYETLRIKYKSVSMDFSKKLSELENLKNMLRKEKRELEKLKAYRDAMRAEKLILENEMKGKLTGNLV